MRSFALIRTAALWLVCVGTAASGTASAAQSIASAGRTLSFPNAGTGGYGVALAAPGETDARALQPVSLLVCGDCTDENKPQPAITAGYGSLQPQGDGSIVATATVTSPAGSTFRFTDRYRPAPQPGAFTLDRTVTVMTAGAADRGFNSQFTVGFLEPVSIDRYHVLAPAIWYDHNTNASPKAFGADLTNTSIYWRETRSGLPFVMMQDPTTGTALSIAHVADKPGTGIDESVKTWVVDASVQNGSIGLQQQPKLTLGFIYPAQETGAGPAGGTGSHWVKRSHPVQAGFSHHYTLMIALGTATNAAGMADYPAALRKTWRLYYDAFDPPVPTLPSDSVFYDGIKLLDTYAANVDGAEGLPFTVDLASGAVKAVSYQMGYVGEQIPLGFQLFRYGVLHDGTTSRTDGEAILNFWAYKSAQSSGLPLPWYFPDKGTFINTTCHNPIFMRQVSDGMEGMVDAAVLARQHGSPQPAWESFAQAFGDWLVRTQNKDGSYYRAFNADGSVYTDATCNEDAFGTSTFDTTHPIRFLVTLYFATGQTKYLNAAKMAGAYALGHIYGPTQYVGGVIDNPDVIDKEAGVEAIHAALALYDATRDATWLQAAEQAADYTETWSYAYGFPINGASPAFQRTGPLGFGLVATGQSSSDISLSYESYDFFRLYLFTGDAHDLAMAKFLQNDTKLTTQIGGTQQQYGFPHDGLVGEAVGFADMAQEKDTGSPVTWLPWLTNAELDPLQRLVDTFGSSSIVDDLRQPGAQLQTENGHVYPAPGSIGWGGSQSGAR